jgi:hypothetical protein
MAEMAAMERRERIEAGLEVDNEHEGNKDGLSKKKCLLKMMVKAIGTFMKKLSHKY